MMHMISTYNSTPDIYSNRRNLIVNFTTNELHLSGSHMCNIGLTIDNMGIRQVNSTRKNLLENGFTEVDDQRVMEWRRREVGV